MRLHSLPVLVLVLAACASSQTPQYEFEPTPRLYGPYSGTFTVIDAYSTPSPQERSGSFDLALRGEFYHIFPHNHPYPPCGSGFVYVDDENRITFQRRTRSDDNNPFPSCFYTADFDWSLIIDGGYDYSTDGDRIVLEKYDAEHDRLERLVLERSY